MASLNWDNDRSLELITEFRKREILWDSKNASFFNQVKKEEAWKELGLMFGMGVDEVKRKMDSLRGSYRRERNRVKRKNKSLEGTSDVFISSWFAFASMQFLGDGRSGDARKESYSMDHSDMSYDNQDIFQTKSESRYGLPVRTEDPLVTSAHRAGEHFLSQSTPTHTLQDNTSSKLEDILPVLKSLSENVLKRDEHDVFGEHISNKLRNCRKSWQEKAIAQHKINNILFQLEMGQFGQEVSTYAQPQSSGNGFVQVSNSDHVQYSPGASNNSLDQMSPEQMFCDVTIIKNEIE